MRFGPQSVQGWIVFSITLIATSLVAAWAFGKAELDAGVKEILLVIVGGLVGVLNGYKSEVPTDAMTKSETVTVSSTEQPGDGQGTEA